MNSCNRVGDIFIEAGKRYNKLGDDIMMLHPSAQELANMEAHARQVHVVCACACACVKNYLFYYNTSFNGNIS